MTCVAGLVVLLVGLFSLFSAADSVSRAGGAPEGSSSSAVVLMASSIPLFVGAAVQLLGVDVARNIRAMRYHQH